MPVLTPRRRMLSFRLSEAEYEGLKDVCVAEGARSISDFARAAICGLIVKGDGNRDVFFQPSLRHLEERIQQLENEVRQLDRLVGITAWQKSVLGEQS